MNSTVVLLDMDTQQEETYTLVFPEIADANCGYISVLAPIGMAMMGYQVGDTFEWPVPDGTRRLRVKEILYQPEAAGDYHLWPDRADTTKGQGRNLCLAPSH